jgi:YD repeat-containing protein
MLTMTTQGAAGNATTTWHYDPARGWLDRKQYADGTGTNYTYTLTGQLKTRTWARGITTTYHSNGAGDLREVDYGDTTPDITNMIYDGLGRLTGRIDAAGNLTRALALDGQPGLESWTSGPMAGLTVNRTYDALLRRDGLSAAFSGNALGTPTGYGYSPTTGRLQTVTAGNLSWTYSSTL